MSIITRKSVLRTAGYYQIRVDVTEIKNVKRCKNLVKDIRDGLAVSFGLDQSLIEISRPSPIPKGLRLSITIRMNNVKQIDMNVIKMMQEMNDSGELAEILRTAWTLTKSPMISNIKSEYIQSQHMQDNEVVIKSASVSRSPSINEHQVQMSPISADMVAPVLVTGHYDLEREGNEIANETAIENNIEDIMMAKLDENVAFVENDQDAIDDIDNMMDIVAVVDMVITPGNEYIDDNFTFDGNYNSDKINQ